MRRIIGIDVGSGKGGHIYEGESCVSTKLPDELRLFLESLPTSTLVTWDAPLTGPSSTEGSLLRMDLTERVIESFFKAELKKSKIKGISVLGYAGCSHWTISRRLLGLPRIGPWDSAGGLPFELVVSDQDRNRSGRMVVEVHPTLAIWLWCRHSDVPSEILRYKERNKEINEATRKERVKSLWSILYPILSKNLLDHNYRFPSKLVPKKDDEIDAVVAWVLGKLWIEGSKSVALLGSRAHGTFLLPYSNDLWEAFSKYAKERSNARTGRGHAGMGSPT